MLRWIQCAINEGSYGTLNALKTMMTTICFLVGIGIPEIIILALFVMIIVAIVKVLLWIANRSKKNAASANNFGQTPILKNAEKLKELKSLLDSGIISSEEFEAEKKKILNA